MSKAKLRPGDVRIIAGMIALLGGAIWLAIAAFHDAPRFWALKRDGLTVDGQIVNKQIRSSSGARRKLESSSEDYFFDIAFDSKRGVPYVSATPSTTTPTAPAARTGKEIVAALKLSKQIAVIGDTRVRINAGSFQRFASHRIGDAISVTYLANDPASAALTEVVRRHRPWLPGAGAAVLSLVGTLLCVTGIRRRRYSMMA